MHVIIVRPCFVYILNKTWPNFNHLVLNPLTWHIPWNMENWTTIFLSVNNDNDLLTNPLGGSSLLNYIYLITITKFIKLSYLEIIQ